MPSRCRRVDTSSVITDSLPIRPRIFIPGWGGSGPGHWQTLWQAQLRGSRRVELRDWLGADRATWIAGIDRTVRDTVADTGIAPILVAHSLGCIAVAAWAAQHRRPIAGALLVAPADPDAPSATSALRVFAPTPLAPLPFPSTLVTSDDDPYVSVERAREFASAWGSDLQILPGAGHLNVASGHGEWPDGLALLRALSTRQAA